MFSLFNFSLLFSRQITTRRPGKRLYVRTVKHVSLNEEDAVDRYKWRNVIKEAR